MHSRRFKNSSCVRRHGLSIVEFVGCLVAMGGGVLLGAMYLGIDLQAVATDTLEKAHEAKSYFAEDSPEESEKQSPESSKTQSASSLEADSPTSETANQETVELSATKDSSPTIVNEQTTFDAELTEAQRASATQVYWKALSESVGAELAARKSGGKSEANWQMFDHLEHRRVAHQRAADQIKQLDEHGVDRKVLDHAAKVLSWHLAGVQLYQRALDLITDGPSSDLLGPLAQSWQSAATQHRMEEKLVQVKHVSVAGYLSHTYKELGTFKPATTP